LDGARWRSEPEEAGEPFSALYSHVKEIAADGLQVSDADLKPDDDGEETITATDF
jgi:hypothetical protein